MRHLYLLIVATSIIGFTNCTGDAKEKKQDSKNDKTRITDNSNTSELLNFDLSSSPVLIIGEITNFRNKTLQIGDDEAKIDSLGRFELKFQLSEPNIYTLKYHGNQTELFLAPNDTLEIQFNADNFYNSISFSGSNQKIQKFLVDVAIKSIPMSEYFSKQWEYLISLPEKEFVAKINEQKSRIVKPINEFINNNSEQINPWFNKYYKLKTELTFNRLIYIYLQLHFDYISQEDQLSFRDRYKYIESFNYDDPELLTDENYISLMKSILRLKVIDCLLNDNELKKSDNQWITAYQKTIKNSFTNNTVRDYWLYYYLYDHIDNYGVKNIDHLVKDFNSLCTNSTYKHEINDYYQKEIENRRNHPIKTYKTIDGFNLDAHIFKPKDIKRNEKRAAILYFHGGAFSMGKPDWHCHYDDNGFVQISFEYRIYDRHGTMPFAAFEDAKSAIRWVRENAEELQIDTSKIIATGNSVGAAMSYVAALYDGLDNPAENLNISSKPNAIILNAAGYDQTNKFGPVKDKSKLAKVSGINIVKPNSPPCLVIHGSRDWGIPISEAKEFVKKMRSAGNLCEFKILEGAGHVPWLNPPYSTEAYNARQDFLKQIGYINK
jgi:acetyl esterase/lipase